jgi:hypothetical protein
MEEKEMNMRINDEIIRAASADITRRLHSNPDAVTTSELKAILDVTINSEFRSELDKRGQCNYCASADSGHNVHCRNFREAVNA